MPPDVDQNSSLAAAIQEVTEKAQLVVREEIELAKAEVTIKAKRLARGVGVGLVAGVFALTGLLFLLHGVAWLLWKLVRNDGVDNFYLGFFILAVLLFVLGGVAGYLAARWIKAGAPPKPQMALEEAKKIKETVTS